MDRCPQESKWSHEHVIIVILAGAMLFLGVIGIIASSEAARTALEACRALP